MGDKWSDDKNLQSVIVFNFIANVLAERAAFQEMQLEHRT